MSICSWRSISLMNFSSVTHSSRSVLTYARSSWSLKNERSSSLVGRVITISAISLSVIPVDVRDVWSLSLSSFMYLRSFIVFSRANASFSINELISSFDFSVHPLHFFMMIFSSFLSAPEPRRALRNKYSTAAPEDARLPVESITMSSVDSALTRRSTEVPRTHAEISSVSRVKNVLSVNGFSTRAQSDPFLSSTRVSLVHHIRISIEEFSSRRMIE